MLTVYFGCESRIHWFSNGQVFVWRCEIKLEELEIVLTPGRTATSNVGNKASTSGQDGDKYTSHEIVKPERHMLESGLTSASAAIHERVKIIAKMDKCIATESLYHSVSATVLEDAANYIQDLQGRGKELEELSGLKRNKMHELVIYLQRDQGLVVVKMRVLPLRKQTWKRVAVK
nr:autophagy-related protein 2 [Tanacetum cinerariifolium]GEX95959.1 autophagy-related protein 2 [Tanacetum cinerariifolium]